MATGQLPHEILLSMARGEIQTEQYYDAASGEIMTRLVTIDLEGRRDAAKAAAPYYAPKMATVELIKTGTDDELDAIIAELAAEAGFASRAAGEGTSDGDQGGTEPESSDGDGEPRRGRRRSTSFED